MKQKMRDTSMLSWYKVMENLGDRQMMVYRALKELKTANNNMIAEHLGIPINQITPRCLELRKMGVVIFYKKDVCPYTKRLSCFWRLRKER